MDPSFEKQIQIKLMKLHDLNIESNPPPPEDKFIFIFLNLMF